MSCYVAMYCWRVGKWLTHLVKPSSLVPWEIVYLMNSWTWTRVSRLNTGGDRDCSKCKQTSLNPPKNFQTIIVFIPVLQIRKLRLRVPDQKSYS